MSAIEDARAAAEFWDAHPDSPSGYLASALSALIAEHERLTAAPAALVGKWSVRDTLTGALYPQPNKLIAEKVAEMHGHSEVVPGWTEATRPTEDEREALGEAALRAYLAPTEPRPWSRLSKWEREKWIAAGLVGFRRQEPITDAARAWEEFDALAGQIDNLERSGAAALPVFHQRSRRIRDRAEAARDA